MYCGDSVNTEYSYYYDANGNISAASVNVHSGNTVTNYKYLFATNIQGDVLTVTDENGEMLISYTYDTWGNFTTSYSTNSELSTKISYAVDMPFRYRGIGWI